ncbi:MAG TPA: galactokinase [Ohtaekwangia sp.]|nr:galactokinase [Ohtaekwangia sp.]
MNSTYLQVLDSFTSRYKDKPLVVRSPGRINLIGEHTDYNEGFVMPAAIHYDTIFAISETAASMAEIYSLSFDEVVRVDVNNPEKVVTPKWANYLFGVMKQFLMQGYTLKPFRCVFGGDIPMGAGLSSSASMECGFAFALNALHQFNVPREKLMFMAQWAEHHYAGVKCGIMDQFASMMGREDHVMVLDCRSMEYDYSPIKLPDHTIVLCDSKVKHALVDSEYNTRRNECEQGVAILKKHYPDIKSLRDATVEMLNNHRDEMRGKVYDRCLYIVEEIQRVREASEDLKANRLEAFGKKMYDTHDGLSKRYEVSCKELDFLVNEARKFGSIAGSRMMGGGFGGCTINLVPTMEVDRFIATVSIAFRAAMAHEMAAYIVHIKDGTNIIHDSGENITLARA